MNKRHLKLLIFLLSLLLAIPISYFIYDEFLWSNRLQEARHSRLNNPNIYIALGQNIYELNKKITKKKKRLSFNKMPEIKEELTIRADLKQKDAIIEDTVMVIRDPKNGSVVLYQWLNNTSPTLKITILQKDGKKFSTEIKSPL